MPRKKKPLIPVERIERSILLIRSHKVILDADLAAMYASRPNAFFSKCVATEIGSQETSPLSLRGKKLQL